MSSLTDAQLAEFAEILASVGTRAVVRGRTAPSILYDSTYQLALIACAFVQHAMTAGGARTVHAPWLKMVQFVAARPGLVPDLKVWLAERKKRSRCLDAWARMPRGYLGDKTHDDAIQLLVAANVLRRAGDDLLEGPRVGYLDAFAKAIGGAGLFESEREVMRDLVEVRPPKIALGGN